MFNYAVGNFIGILCAIHLNFSDILQCMLSKKFPRNSDIVKEDTIEIDS
jgi:hypothetical protein